MYCLFLLELLAQVAPAVPVVVTPTNPFVDFLKNNQTLILMVLAALWPLIWKWLAPNTPIPVINVPNQPGPLVTPPVVVDPNNPNPPPVMVPAPGTPLLPNHPFISSLIFTLLPILIQALIPKLLPVMRGVAKESATEAVRETAFGAVVQEQVRAANDQLAMAKQEARNEFRNGPAGPSNSSLMA